VPGADLISRLFDRRETRLRRAHAEDRLIDFHELRTRANPIGNPAESRSGYISPDLATFIEQSLADRIELPAITMHLGEIDAISQLNVARP
jgi:hypothetical protein